MEDFEQENEELREEITTLNGTVERLNSMVEALVVAHNRQPPEEPQRIVVSEIVSTPIPQYTMPPDRPWGMPYNFTPEGYIPPASEVPRATTMGFTQQNAEIPRSAVMASPRPIMHTFPPSGGQVYHHAPSEDVGVYERLDEFQEQFLQMHKELKTLRGQDLFGKNAADLCLVPNVKIPHKFKVPDFEKYKGNSFPQSHLVMYARRMSTQTDNQQLLIHYFQDSLTGAALKWYMNLDSSEIRTFRDLGEAFVKQYKYNLDIAPDRDQLRAMTQKDRESFKEYAQRWREVAAQICQPLEVKEMTKI